VRNWWDSPRHRRAVAVAAFGVLAVILGVSVASVRHGGGSGDRSIPVPSTGASSPADPTSSAPAPSPSPSSSVATDPPPDPNAPTVISFAGPVGSPPDSAAWNYETGGNGWGNGELETYTRSTRNAFVDGRGRLVVRALKETERGTDGRRRDFTSARITTAGKVVVAPGSYVSATLTAPVGPGVWPAFWLIGTDVTSVGWPRAGELDVFEGDSSAPSVAQTAIHLPSASNPAQDRPYSSTAKNATVDLGKPLDAGPHEYGVYFDANVVRFFIDRKQNMVVTAAQARDSGRLWPFGNPQYMILNVAIDRTGAAYSADFPQDMTVYGISIYPRGIPFAVP
jgi:beta-glucanase (GH16 family)